MSEVKPLNEDMPDGPDVIGDTACPAPKLSEAVLAIADHVAMDATEEAQQEAAVLRQPAALLAQQAAPKGMPEKWKDKLRKNFPNKDEHPSDVQDFMLEEIIALRAFAIAQQAESRWREGWVYVCRASGEGSHDFRVSRDEAGVMAFYKEMFGEQYGGGIQSVIDHFRDPDNWINDGNTYNCELYMAKFEVWKVQANELIPYAAPQEDKE